MEIKERKPYHYKLYLVLRLIDCEKYTFQNLLEKTPKELLNIAYECIDVARTNPCFENYEIEKDEILIEGSKYFQTIFATGLFRIRYVIDVKKTVGFNANLKECDLINVIHSDIDTMSDDEKNVENMRSLINKLQLDQERLNKEIIEKQRKINDLEANGFKLQNKIEKLEIMNQEMHRKFSKIGIMMHDINILFKRK